MTVFAQIKSVILTARFWVYVAILMTLAAGYRFVAPSEMQRAIGSWYQQTGKPSLQNWLKSQSAGQASGADGIQELLQSVPDRLEPLFCVSQPPDAVEPTTTIVSFLATAIPSISLLVLILAMVVPGLIPQPRSTVAMALDPPIEFQRVTRTAALQAGALRVAIVYGLGSCLATVLFPPEDAQSFFASNNTNHLIALIVGAAVATVVALGRMPIELPPKDMALHAAAGGVMVAGFIFMVIVMPYRMRAVDGGLSIEQVRLIALVRMLVLPLVSYLTSWGYFMVRRTLARTP